MSASPLAARKRLLGSSATEDAAARAAIRLAYHSALGVFEGAELNPGDNAYLLDWLSTHAADECEISIHSAGRIVSEILSRIDAPVPRRGNASRARFVVRELLAEPGLVDIHGRRFTYSLQDDRMRDIVVGVSAERCVMRPGIAPLYFRKDAEPCRAAFARGVDSQGGWEAWLYRERLDYPKLSRVVRARIKRVLTRENATLPGHTDFEYTPLQRNQVLPDGRLMLTALREWMGQADRPTGAVWLANQYLRQRV